MRPSTNSSAAFCRRSRSSTFAFAVSRLSFRPVISLFSRVRSASLTKPRPEMPIPIRIPIASATKTAASDIAW